MTESDGKGGKHGGKHTGGRQLAQKLKKQRINKIISALAANKAFFMSFIRFPSMKTLQGIDLLLNALQEMRETPAYLEMRRVSERRTEELTQLTRKRDEARERVPVDLALKINCLGTEEMIRDRLRVYRDAGVTTFRAGVGGTIEEQLETLGRLVSLVDEVSAEPAAT